MYNFNSGPATLPPDVLQEAARAVVNYGDTGLSILEIPHRGALFTELLEEGNALVRELLSLNADYEVLWLQGGGRMQFSMVPMNFLGPGETAGYIDSGHWAADAIKNAAFYGNTEIIASSRNEGYRNIPRWEIIPDTLAYLHITTNNTIYGTQFFRFPETQVPLVADMSSELFSRTLDYNQFDLIYAVAQKNIGPAGVTLVVIKKSLLEKQKRELPGILSYKTIAAYNSVWNTPPVFAIYCSVLNLRRLRQTGLQAIESRNEAKARQLYEAIDGSRLFYGTAQEGDRSRMNVCFRARKPELESAFMQFAKERNITGIEGHRSVGGFRAALYNAVTPEAVTHLINVMQTFEADHTP